MRLSDYMTLVYMFAADIPPYLVERMVPNVSQVTILSVYGRLRKLCSEKVWAGLLLGEDANGSIVEIDESYFGKSRKYNKGKVTQHIWVFGVVDSETGKLLLKCVPNRKKETLVPIMQKHVSPQATIHHDDFSTYRRLQDAGFCHGAVNHSKEFKSKDGVCTNTIEGVWGLVKNRIRSMHGVRHEHLQDILDEFMYRHKTGDIFNKLIKDLAV